MMQFTIISPTEQQEFIIDWLKVQTPQGDFVIQPGHMPTIVALTPNKEIVFSSNNTEKKISIKSGVLEVNRKSITLIVV